MKRWQNVLLVLVGFAFFIFVVGAFILGFGYAAFGWSTIVTWRNTSCSVLHSYSESNGAGKSARNVFEVMNANEKVFRQAAVVSVADARFLAMSSSTELAAQAASLVGLSNATCFVPQYTFPYSNSVAMVGSFAYYNINTVRNFVLLNYSSDALQAEVAMWRSLIIAGSVLMGTGALIGVLVLLWWAIFLREKKAPPPRRREQSWQGRPK